MTRYFPAQLARFFTVTLHEADFPLEVVAVTVVVPSVTPVTSPDDETVTIDVLEDSHVMDELVLSGSNVYGIVNVSPIPTVISDGNEMLVGSIFSTLTLQVVLTPLPSAALHVIVALPGPTPFTHPSDSTVATLALPDAHVTVLSLA